MTKNRRKEWPVEDLFVEFRHNKRHDDDCENCDEQESKIDIIEKELIAKGDLTKKQMDKLLDISQKNPVPRTLQSDIKIEHQ